MKFSKTILSALLLASTTTFADTYNGEVGLKYVDNGIAIANAVLPVENVSSLQVRGTYNFSAVDTTNKPLAEADFLGKHSFINASHAAIDPDGWDKFDVQSVGLGFYIPNSIFYVGAQYVKADDSDNTSVSVGITPVDGLLIITSYSDGEGEYNANIAAKYVVQLAGDTALNLEAAYLKGEDAENDFEDDEEDTFLVGADYYFTNRFSIGAAYTDNGESTYTLRSRYFYTEKVSFDASVASNDEEDSLSLGAAIRF